MISCYYVNFRENSLPSIKKKKKAKKKENKEKKNQDKAHETGTT